MRQLAAVITLVLLIACGSGQSNQRNIDRIALLTTGAPANPGWSGAAARGLAALHDSLLVDVTQIAASDDSSALAALRRFGGQAYPLVFLDGPTYQAEADRAATEYPTTDYVVINGDSAFTNIHVLELRVWEASFLLGRMAASLSSSGVVGYVGDAGDPTAASSALAWRRGTGGKVMTRRAWSPVPMSAAEVQDSALAVVAAGADQLFHGITPTALGVFSVARTNSGVMVYGAGDNQASVAPELVPASAVVDVPLAMLLTTKRLQRDGTLPRKQSYGLASGVIRIVINDLMRGDPLSTMLVQQVFLARDSIVTGTLEVLATGDQE